MTRNKNHRPSIENYIHSVSSNKKSFNTLLHMMSYIMFKFKSTIFILLHNITDNRELHYHLSAGSVPMTGLVAIDIINKGLYHM